MSTPNSIGYTLTTNRELQYQLQSQFINLASFTSQFNDLDLLFKLTKIPKIGELSFVTYQDFITERVTQLTRKISKCYVSFLDDLTNEVSGYLSSKTEKKVLLASCEDIFEKGFKNKNNLLNHLRLKEIPKLAKNQCLREVESYVQTVLGSRFYQTLSGWDLQEKTDQIRKNRDRLKIVSDAYEIRSKRKTDFQISSLRRLLVCKWRDTYLKPLKNQLSSCPKLGLIDDNHIIVSLEDHHKYTNLLFRPSANIFDNDDHFYEAIKGKDFVQHKFFPDVNGLANVATNKKRDVEYMGIAPYGEDNNSTFVLLRDNRDTAVMTAQMTKLDIKEELNDAKQDLIQKNFLKEKSRRIYQKNIDNPKFYTTKKEQFVSLVTYAGQLKVFKTSFEGFSSETYLIKIGKNKVVDHQVFDNDKIAVLDSAGYLSVFLFGSQFMRYKNFEGLDSDKYSNSECTLLDEKLIELNKMSLKELRNIAIGENGKVLVLNALSKKNEFVLLSYLLEFDRNLKEIKYKDEKFQKKLIFDLTPARELRKKNGTPLNKLLAINAFGLQLILGCNLKNHGKLHIFTLRDQGEIDKIKEVKLDYDVSDDLIWVPEQDLVVISVSRLKLCSVKLSLRDTD